VKVTLWGTRGSLASAGPETVRYGGNTACTEVRADDGSLLILDAGSGIRRLGHALGGTDDRVDILLSHLHMDHIQGLGFFAPLFRGLGEIHIWGPPSIKADLRHRLGRYLSPPLFPVMLRDLGSRLVLHDAPAGPTRIGPFVVQAALVVHPGPTIGYRIGERAHSLAYLPDHEPALGWRGPSRTGRWTSGHDLAAGVDLLVHDAQYTADEYRSRVGWGHSNVEDVLAFAELAGIGHLVTFHHDPGHSDDALDALHDAMISRTRIHVEPGKEGVSFEL
jgi:phosphoribosyl 1,2-cyclic phosphodiesterase